MNNIDTDKSSVLLIVFNRIDKVKKVLPAIKAYAPKKLYVAADGPRPTHETDFGLTEEVRNYILKEIDWDCKIITKFSDKNLGCKYGPLSAINWFFENEEQGIILEDDILPTQSFFNFCDYFLKHFKNNKEIFSITGINLNEKLSLKNEDYFYAGYSFTWGWATWKSRWEKYKEVLKDFNSSDPLSYVSNGHKWDKASVIGLHKKVAQSLKDEIDAWDFPWAFTQFINKGYSVVPSKNLVKNIGFDAEGTHTHSPPHYLNNKVSEIKFPLNTNETIINNKKYDIFICKEIFNWKSLTEKITDINHYKNYLKSKF
ncbi:nucleotide-diphospho-sugar transferase [Maribacter confluentis]|uniref:Nucleotide-diphospho-sugar transferase n=1 Tax=Maribacter confluentis TaxID=1656093 RepID=A0ABT8RTU0_9FLAO|nr:nucleotide-diphospho-sugar transferase [Maribacter confluentis]MDO1514323.1 nucleotide-diphospho-sugar transferase [Maribacter confluentis]